MTACWFFLFEVLLRLSIAEDVRSFLLRWECGVDLLTISPSILELCTRRGWNVDLAFLRFARLLKLVRLLKIHRLTKRTDSLIQRKIMILCFSMITVVICSAGAFLEAEHEQIQYFHDGLYWAFVTIATVGYGDFYPETTAGKFVVIFTILLVVTLVPHQMNELISLFYHRSYYERCRYVCQKGGNHIIVTGSLRFEPFLDFVEEFLHPDHGFEDRDIVLLYPKPPERDFERFLRRNERIHYVQGSPIHRKDIARTAAKDAAAIFIFSDKHETDLDIENETNALISLSLSHYLQTVNDSNLSCLPHILIQMLSPDARTYLASLMEGPSKSLPETSPQNIPNPKPNVSVLCLQELKLAMLSQSCLDCPGVIVLMCNLCRSIAFDIHNKATETEWKQEYLHGASMEIYRTRLPIVFNERTFSEAARILFDQFGIVLIGIEITDPNRSLSSNDFNPEIYIAPMDYDVSQTAGFVLAPDLETILEIAEYEIESTSVAFELNDCGKSPNPHFISYPSNLSRHQRNPSETSSGIIKDTELSENLPRWKGSLSCQRKSLSFDSEFRQKDLPRSECGFAKTLMNSCGQVLGSSILERSSSLLRKTKSFRSFSLPSSVSKQRIESPHPTTFKFLIQKPNLQTFLTSSVRRAFDEAIVREIAFENHIVIFGISAVQSLFHLIAPLRSRHLKTIQPVVLIDHQKIASQKWDEISSFQAIYFFQGSAKSPKDLNQLNLSSASKAIILPSRQRRPDDVYHEARLDADVVLTYNQLTALNPYLEIFMDIHAATNLTFLMPTLEPRKGTTANFITSPLFASGHVFLSGIMDTLFCQAFHNSDILPILQKILLGASEHTNRLSSPSVHLTLHPLPDVFVDDVFGNAFRAMLETGALCIGIYRKGRFQRGNISPYVYTNPPSNLVLEKDDDLYLFVEDRTN